MPKPSNDDYPDFFSKYVNLVNEDNILSAFENQQSPLDIYLNSITEENANFKYASDKWSIKLVFQHLIDAERIFSYRALCIARGERINLPGFDQDIYAQNSSAELRSWSSITSELQHVRSSTIDLFNSFNENNILNKGTVNGHTITALSLGYIIVGHTYHHLQIMKDRY